MPRFLIPLIICAFYAQTASAQEYTVNPGDAVTITVWEKDSLSGVVVVDDSGHISLPPPIGSIKVSGLTAAGISQLLTEKLKEYVRNPTVFVSVTPAQGFTVHVLGEVQAPNFFTVPEGVSLQEVITRAGGFSELADVKRIRLIRKDKDAGADIQPKERSIDFSRFAEDGDLTANPALEQDDVIVVPRLSRIERAGQTVTVIGAVNSSGTFPLEEPLSLVEVLALAGWPSDAADMKNISIMDISGQKDSWERVDLEAFPADGTVSSNPGISPGKIVFVPKIEIEDEKRTFLVNVVGQVKKTGAYPVPEGARLFDVIGMAGGITDEAAIDRVTIIHAHPILLLPSSQSATRHVDLTNYLTTGDLSHNPQLAEGDTVIVPMSEDATEVPGIHTTFSPSIRVSIVGEVTSPNTYQISPGASILDVLRLAGGPAKDADLRKVTVLREQTEGQQRLKVDMEKVLTEGEFSLLPPEG